MELRDARLKAGLSQMQAAIQVGGKCNPSSISRYENDTDCPSVTRLLDLCRVYKLHPGRLLIKVAGKR